MSKGIKIIVVLSIAVIVMVALGVLSLSVGGVSIRSASQTYKMGEVSVVNPVLLPGVPVTVGIDFESLTEAETSLTLLLRLSSETVVVDKITRAELSEGKVSVVLPCVSGNGGNKQARLVLVESDTQSVLAQSEKLIILEQGPDCL